MNETLVSELMYQNEALTTEQILKALLRGDKLRLKKASQGVNYWLEDGQLKSNTISYLKGIPITWFNPDVKYVIDD